MTEKFLSCRLHLSWSQFSIFILADKDDKFLCHLCSFLGYLTSTWRYNLCHCLHHSLVWILHKLLTCLFFIRNYPQAVFVTPSTHTTCWHCSSWHIMVQYLHHSVFCICYWLFHTKEHRDTFRLSCFSLPLITY